jgi:hypothetical protein
MRDVKPFLALVVVCGLLLLVVPWWIALGVFVVGYIALGHLTYQWAIVAIREVTGLDFYRANAVYKAALSGDWSKIPTNELRTPKIPTNELRTPVPLDRQLALLKGPQAKFKRQLIALIIMERNRRYWADYEQSHC